MIHIALAGNPNVGKTSLYNRITHSLEHVGNWHGVTVEKKEKIIVYGDTEVAIADLPGFYSLTVYSLEEGVSRDCILGGTSDMIVNICEVGNLSRNLYLTLQLLEHDVPIVLVVNMMDELNKRGKSFDSRKIENALKIPIIPMSAKYNSDVQLLMDSVLARIKKPANNADLYYLRELPLDKVCAIISQNAARAGLGLRYAAIKVLENDPFIIKKLALCEKQLSSIACLGDWQARVAEARYRFIDEITKGAVVAGDVNPPKIRKYAKNNPIKAVDDLPSKTRIAGNDGGRGESKFYSCAEKCGKGFSCATGVCRYGFAEAGGALRTACPKESDRSSQNGHHAERKTAVTALSRFDRIALNKYLALPLFLALMLLIFVLTFGLFGKWLSDGLAWLIDRFVYANAVVWLDNASAPSWVISLVGEGIIKGVGGIIVFLPQITLLFLFLAFLEDSGYISRVAFMTDGMFRKIGLSGRAAFTMIMGFGCSATAVLTARGLEDEKMRKKTVLLTPFMSCSARLPVYILLVGSFFGGNPLVIFALYILGAATALLLATVFQKVPCLKSGKLSFIMEIPPYRIPTFERVFQLIWHNVKTFLVRVGTVIFMLSVIVWVLSSFSLSQGFVGAEQQGSSIMASIGRLFAPMFRPLGFGSWQAVTALLSGLVAKEVIISSIASLGGIETLFVGEHAALSALCFLVFVLLYVPCFATIVVISKEIGVRWAVFNFCLQTAIAYAAALLVRFSGLLFQKHAGVCVAAIVVASVVSVAALTLAKYLRRKKNGECSELRVSGCGKCGSVRKQNSAD